MQDPNTNFQNITRRTVDILHLIVLLLLPVIWMGDYKNLISLLFKTIRFNDPYSVEITPTVYAIIIVLGLVAYIAHRYYRQKEYSLRYETLIRENPFVDTYDYEDVKLKLLKKLNNLLGKQYDEWEFTQDITKKGTDDEEWEQKNITDWTTDTSTEKTVSMKIKKRNKSVGGESRTSDSSKASSKPKRHRWNAQGIFRKSHSDAESCIKRRRL